MNYQLRSAGSAMSWNVDVDLFRPRVHVGRIQVVPMNSKTMFNAVRSRKAVPSSHLNHPLVDIRILLAALSLKMLEEDAVVN